MALGPRPRWTDAAVVRPGRARVGAFVLIGVGVGELGDGSLDGVARSAIAGDEAATRSEPATIGGFEPAPGRQVGA